MFLSAAAVSYTMTCTQLGCAGSVMTISAHHAVKWSTLKQEKLMTNKESTRVIVAGGRDFNDQELMDKVLDHYLEERLTADTHITIVSGRARGADLLGERWARDRGNYFNVSSNVFKPDWDLHGKSAGYKRNVTMADNAEYLIAFWDGKSKGTKHMIDLGRKLGLHVVVINYTAL
jgi:hypothetical protein